MTIDIKSSFQKYTLLCRYFFEQVDACDMSNESEFVKLNAAVIAFRDICKDTERAKAEKDSLFYSCMFDVFIWLGLKHDEPSMAQAQAAKIRDSYPEIFTNFE